MQTYPAVPPNPLFGELAWGFVLIIIYVFARIAGEGEGRYIGCKRALSVGILGMAVVALLESLNYWTWSLQIPPFEANPFLIWGVSMLIGLPFVIVPMIDLTVQWYRLRK